MKHVDKFFAYAKKRHAIFLDREDGKPAPWTDDPILQTNKFCNVFRENDKVTRWFAKHVREPLRNKTPDILLATVTFRMFNRITTGEAMFSQLDMLDGGSAFQQFLHDGRTAHLKKAIKAVCGRGPFVTGSYTVSSPPGYTKLDGVLWILDKFYKSDWRTVEFETMYGAWEWLRHRPFLGKFHSYEIVTDLRHTDWFIGGQPGDAMDWANVGPGARRGMNRVCGRPYKDKSVRAAGIVEEMRDLLAFSRDARFWPQPGKRTAEGARNAALWPRWELRDVEHTLCEFDKYERVRLGQGRPRGSFDGTGK